MFENAGDLRDVEVRKPYIPAGTKVTQELVGVEAKDEETTKPYLNFTFNVTGPNGFEGTKFEQRAYCSARKAGKEIGAWDITRRLIKELVQAYESDEDVVNGFLRGCTSLEEIATTLTSKLSGRTHEAVLTIDENERDGKKFKRQQVESFTPAA